MQIDIPIKVLGPYALSEQTPVSTDDDLIKAPVVILAPEGQIADGVGFSDQGELPYFPKLNLPLVMSVTI